MTTTPNVPQTPPSEAVNTALPAGSELVNAAQAVVERWDSPKWKDLPHTAEFIERLRKALTQPVNTGPSESEQNVLNALAIMDARWPGYQTAKEVIRRAALPAPAAIASPVRDELDEWVESLEVESEIHAAARKIVRLVHGNASEGNKLDDPIADNGYTVEDGLAHDVHCTIKALVKSQLEAQACAVKKPTLDDDVKAMGLVRIGELV